MAWTMAILAVGQVGHRDYPPPKIQGSRERIADVQGHVSPRFVGRDSDSLQMVSGYYGDDQDLFPTAGD